MTEASPLTYPENVSTDEDNTVIFRKGNRSRRLGIDYETGFLLSDFTNTDPTFAEQEYRWNSVNNDGGTNFLVQQVGATLYFYDLSADPLSAGRKTFTVDLTTFKAPAATGIEQCEVSMASGKGLLFVVGRAFEPFVIEYDPDTDTIEATRIYIRVRDMDGVSDGLANDEEPTTLSNEHQYNLMNQGWISPTNTGSGGTVSYFDSFGNPGTYQAPGIEPINEYYDIHARYPANNKPFWIAKRQNPDKDVFGDFDPRLHSKLFYGNNRSARGHFILNAFHKDRTAFSGVPNLPVEVENERPPTVSFFAGRVWYAINGTVYFSQLLTEKGRAGACYQDADPTSEEISDLLPTDGGVILIPEMGRAVRLFAAGSGMMVFANNGIWFITGGSGAFGADDFSVSKLSPIGTDSPNSIVEADGQIFWWSHIGIQAMTQKTGIFGPVEGNFDKTNISETTIQSYFNDEISARAKSYVKGVYDPATNVISWLWSTDSVPGNYRYNRILHLDLTLQAFYPWSISSASGRPWVTGIFTTPNINRVAEAETVTAGGEPVTNSLGSTVTTTGYDTAIRDGYMKFMCITPDNNYTFALFSNANFADWESSDGTGFAYTSFLETGFELAEDAIRFKSAPYIWTYFRRTEEAYEDTGDGNLTLTFPSSCKLRVKFDWADTSTSNKWSREVEAYRLGRFPFVSGPTVFDNGFPVIVSKHRIRGKGRAIQLRFECSEIGKNFDLLGWAVQYAADSAA